MKRFYLAILFLACFSVVAPNSFCRAGIDLPWSTTYDCAEWSYNGTLNCDGLADAGGWSACGHVAEITTPANMAAGGGGRGQRQWTNSGTNQCTAGIRAQFNTPTSTQEVWMRWYIRYEAGYSWARLNYDKIIYTFLEPRSADCEIIWEWYGMDGFRLASQGMSGADSPTVSSGGWTTMMGGPTSDGNWHCIEVHQKLDTNGSNGVAEVWIDGNQIMSKSGLNFGGQSHGNIGINCLLIGSNQEQPNGGCKTVDFDDIAISNTGYIGPFIGVPPSPPKNPRLQ